MKEYGYTKHYAIHNITNKRLILLCVENERQRGTTIAVAYDELDAETRAELIQIIDSPECQAVKDSWTVLSKKIFMEHPQYTALDYLTKCGFAKTYPVEELTVYLTSTPSATSKMPLTKLIQQINDYEAERFSKAQTTPFVDFTAPVNNDVQPAGLVVKNLEPIPEPTPKTEPTSNNDALANILMKMTDKLEEMCNKLDTLNSKSEPKTSKKKSK